MDPARHGPGGRAVPRSRRGARARAGGAMLIHGATDNDLHPPLFGATQRSFGLFRGLARHHDVRVLCIVPNRTRKPREERVAEVTLLRRSAWYTSAAWRLERARLSPLFLASLAHSARARAFRDVLPGTADVCMADLPLAGVLESRPARLRVLHAHNVEYDHFREAGPTLLARGFWAERLRALEARAARGADLVVAASDEDAARFRALYAVAPEALTVIPNGFDETAVCPPAPAERARARAAIGIAPGEFACLFVGSDVPHNREALAAAVGHVMPPLAREGFKLLVVGSISRALEGRREPWLIVHPATPDLSRWLHAADAGLNPVTRGGGSNVKLATYLAAGLAAVSTPFGVRGYAPLVPLVTVAAIEQMAEAVRERPRGAAARGELPSPAIRAYAWGALGERLAAEFERRLGARAEPRAALADPARAGASARGRGARA
ncbi:MAG: glycosyltransferase family 4 protein [Candidatus Eisenbacteria bacterium]|uniref:Glycosyltransferase family 4 protein n=1 Tax=Eiseniibacteriota bacterium TaxID=2212470 RepID=A0A538S8M6_UNCEI|nr:MAG: glycosyltransferase family 4 protein [Candidatus Eisenbacteria bacterium]